MTQLSDRQMAGYLKAAGFPASALATGVAVGLAESGGRTDALNTANRNGSWDAGFMQINSIHGYSQAALFNPVTNAAAAFKIWTAAGGRWTPWSTYNSGSFRVYLARGSVAAQSPTTAPGGIPGGTPTTVPVSNLNNPVPNILNPFAMFADTGLWVRVGLMLLGAFLMLIGLVKLSGVGRIVAKVVPIARAVSK